MARFSLPPAYARLHPTLSGEDMQFIRDMKDSGKTNLESFKELLKSKNIPIPKEIESTFG